MHHSYSPDGSDNYPYEDRPTPEPLTQEEKDRIDAEFKRNGIIIGILLSALFLFYGFKAYEIIKNDIKLSEAQKLKDENEKRYELQRKEERAFYENKRKKQELHDMEVARRERESMEAEQQSVP